MHLIYCSLFGYSFIILFDADWICPVKLNQFVNEIGDVHFPSASYMVWLESWYECSDWNELSEREKNKGLTVVKECLLII